MRVDCQLAYPKKLQTDTKKNITEKRKKIDVGKII